MQGYKTLTVRVLVKRLTVSCRVIQNPKGAKLREATEVTVTFGPHDLGQALLGGRYSESEAMAEFRKRPKAWKYNGEYPKPVSNVDVFLGPIRVAHGYGIKEDLSDCALEYFKAHPENFVKGEGWSAAQALGLISREAA